MELKDAMGVKRAARRKLKHELGIEPEQVRESIFCYTTHPENLGFRLANCASSDLKMYIMFPIHFAMDNACSNGYYTFKLAARRL